MTETDRQVGIDRSVVMDDCCLPARDPRISSHFDKLTLERTARGVLPPMMPVSRRLFSLLHEDAAASHPQVLELGCGSGALGVGLLERGAVRYDGVDLSAEALAAARRRGENAGVVDLMGFTLGDGARVALTPHDWVVMDRVICCYPDWESLLANAIGAARQRVAFSVPTSRGVRGFANRIWWGLEARIANLRRGVCPGYVHSLDRIESRLADAGFRHARSRTEWMWYTAVWDRGAA